MNYSYYLFDRHFGETGTPHYEGNCMKEDYSEKPKIPLRRSARIRANQIISDSIVKKNNQSQQKKIKK